ncbi:MAG: S-layer homology domain-containing protein [Armatimonadetes bacterium]|nr:S-layer homology domain-containing protein [Armatimonadota bacterium]
MKRTLKYALSTVLATAMVLPAIAQENFPDVPDHHWAYEALARMKKEGLLIGYPDGLFRGPRPATRYELAVACHAVYVALKNVVDGMDASLKAMEAKSSTPGGSADMDSMKSAIDALKSDVASMKGWGDDISALKKMTSSFEKELSGMGVDVEAMKKGLKDIDSRVSALEKRKMPVNISGDVNFWAAGGYSQSSSFGITVDGRPTGVGRGDYGGSIDGAARVGALRDLTVLHEGAISLSGTNETGPKWGGTLVTGNMLGFGAFGSQSTTNEGMPFVEAPQDFYVQDFWVKFDTSVAKLAFDATVGRMGVKVSPYAFQRPDTTPYFSNERWDNGKWTLDGGMLGFNFGKATLNVVLGRNVGTSVGQEIGVQPMVAGRSMAAFEPTFDGSGGRPRGLNSDAGIAGALPINTVLGTTVGVPLSDKGMLNLDYLWLNSDAIIGGANSVQVYGGDAKFDVGMFNLWAGYSKSDLKYNNTNVLNKNNDAYWGQVGYGKEKWNLKVGYRQINPFFAAPGDWGRIGIWYNPTDIKGGYGSFTYDMNSTMKFNVSGGIYTGTGKDASGLSTSDKLDHFNIGVDYKFAPTNTLSLGYEEVDWDLKDRASSDFTGGKPKERWYNIGLGFDLSDSAKLSFLWQISDYDSKGVAAFNPFAGSAFYTTAKGGLITTQLSVKF